ncbi:hypothetical protein [Dokdonella fugitiva]|jgi:hypothetical protein|uniref:Uncharacterized protein n=1 Tax=Dokdonella fugitiva TaxID=328517 RepID=A0A4R2IA62_9GAMM|nr:hypothetical protein [Dokdonella fugitiva]MBA8883601.1 hypothetical protein [Dokdonella fugitiva]TCO41343.1 hypothetical protein EV148_103263 [Dokdonella fugitiva]
MVRVVLAAIVGGLLMFVWGAVSHVVLPFERDALRPLPNEAAVMANLGSSLDQPGMYYFPWLDYANATPQQHEAWKQRIAGGPSGLLIYRPNGGEAMSPRQLVTEFVSNVLAALLGALLLVQLGGGVARRVLSMAAIGVIAWLSISVSQWTWYGFPTSFLLGDLADQFGGWLLAGIGMSLLIKPRRVRSF